MNRRNEVLLSESNYTLYRLSFRRMGSFPLYLQFASLKAFQEK